jgi:hypothetical protein
MSHLDAQMTGLQTVTLHHRKSAKSTRCSSKRRS